MSGSGSATSLPPAYSRSRVRVLVNEVAKLPGILAAAEISGNREVLAAALGAVRALALNLEEQAASSAMRPAGIGFECDVCGHAVTGLLVCNCALGPDLSFLRTAEACAAFALRDLRRAFLCALRRGIGGPAHQLQATVEMRYADFLHLFGLEEDKADGLYLGTPRGVTYTPKKQNEKRISAGRVRDATSREHVVDLDQAALQRVLRLSERGTNSTSSAYLLCVLSASQGTMKGACSLPDRAPATVTHKTMFSTEKHSVKIQFDTFRYDPGTGAVTLPEVAHYATPLTATETGLLGINGVLSQAPQDWPGVLTANRKRAIDSDDN